MNVNDGQSPPRQLRVAACPCTAVTRWGDKGPQLSRPGFDLGCLDPKPSVLPTAPSCLSALYVRCAVNETRHFPIQDHVVERWRLAQFVYHGSGTMPKSGRARHCKVPFAHLSFFHNVNCGAEGVNLKNGGRDPLVEPVAARECWAPGGRRNVFPPSQWVWVEPGR